MWFKKKMTQLALGLLCLSATLFLQIHPIPYLNTFLYRVNGILYDYMTYLNLHKKEQSAHVVVVDIDDQSIQAEGRWPWPRNKLANLINQLKKAGAAVVTFDIVLSEAEINYALGLKDKLLQLPPDLQNARQIIPLLDDISKKVDNDQAFASALKNNDVVLGYLFHHDASIKKGALPEPVRNENNQPIENTPYTLKKFDGYNGLLPLFLQSAPRPGFVSNIPDVDGVMRHGLLLANYDKKVYASLSLSTVMHYLMVDKISLIHQKSLGKQELVGIDIGGTVVPTTPDGQILIPYWGLPGTIDSYSATDILNHKVPDESLAGSIVIVGSTMVLLADLHQSPVSQSFPGVEIVANIVSGILSQQVPVEFDWSTPKGLSIIVCIGLILTLLLPFLGPVALFTVYISSLLGMLATSYLLFAYQTLYLTSAIILFLITLQSIINFLYNYIQERRQKDKIRQLFGQYVSPSYVRLITDNPDSYTLDGENVEMTVFFADIRGFTTLSEALDAGEVKRLLNAFFTPLTEIIFNHKGTIDKYVGDMLMAFWGAPLIDPQHPFNGVDAAFDIKRQLPQINEALKAINLPEVAIGMGLSTGLMNVGDMGSSFRRAYTVIGDTVNLASRLQDLTKFYQVDILVAEATREKQDHFFWYPVDKVAVKGRKKPLMIHTPLSYYQEATDAMKEELQAYEQGLAFYFKQEWDSAAPIFETLIANNPTRFLFQLYLERTNEFRLTPPPADWDGTFIHLHK